MSEIKLFEKEEFGKVRVVMQDEDPWFVAKDVAVALGYASTNMTTVFQAVPDEWKGSNRIATPGGEQEMLIISEPGLYSLILRSRKPEAKAFKRWVTHEVIPSIRKTGSYGTGQKTALPFAISTPLAYRLAAAMTVFSFTPREASAP